ncbi:MAG TPA: hypothetical protein VM942_05765 [Acidimicrobiales bacterium]|nr:hypothetical protein [Acidimicrobiales bacterium]
MRSILQLRLSDREGRALATRRAANTVLVSGAHLVAGLFRGAGGPITHMGVGTSDADPDDVTVTALANLADGDDAALVGDTVAPIGADTFRVEDDDVRRVVRVRVRATLPAASAVGRVREAGLLSRSVGDGQVPTDTLYNRVTFAPIDKGDDHELTLFWEVEFPFGDLQWLS